MSFYSLSAVDIRRRARSISLPNEICDEVVDHFFKWTEASGPEWTVSRMKDIKASMLHYYAHGTLPKNVWVKKVSPNRFAGVWGYLQKQLTSPRGLKKVLRLLNLTTALVAPEVTRRQLDKFFDSVTTPRRDVPVRYHSMLQDSARTLDQISTPKPQKLLTSGRRRPSHEERMLNEWHQLFATGTGRDLLLGWPQDVQALVMGVCDGLFGTQFANSYRGPVPIGNICVTQEPGYKARFYAAPHIWLQQCLDPLKKGLGALLMELPWDGTHDQRIADVHIQKALQEGRTVHCFDLSDATNVFPLELQLTVLRTVVPAKEQRYVTLFESISKFPWYFRGTHVVWERGQALGLGPSFAMFALTHGLLIHALNGGQHNDKFFVIGDDVVILDDSLADAYASALEDLDLPFSPLKTIRSSRVAEFAGYVFTSREKFQIIKWKGLRDDNIVDLVRNWGPEILPFLNTKLRTFFTWFGSLPEPIGFGWNPQGLSFSERVDPYLDLLIERDEPSSAYDADLYGRVAARIRTLPPYEARFLAHSYLKRPKAAERFDRSVQEHLNEITKAFPDHLKPRVLENPLIYGGNAFAAEFYGVVDKIDLPQIQPLKSYKRRVNDSLGLRRLMKKTAPYFDKYKQELAPVNVHSGSISDNKK